MLFSMFNLNIYNHIRTNHIVTNKTFISPRWCEIMEEKPMFEYTLRTIDTDSFLTSEPVKFALETIFQTWNIEM